MNSIRLGCLAKGIAIANGARWYALKGAAIFGINLRIVGYMVQMVKHLGQKSVYAIGKPQRRKMSVELNRDGAIKIIESIQKVFEERRIGMVGIYAEAFNTYIAALEMAKKSLEIDEKYDLAYEDAKAAGPWISVSQELPINNHGTDVLVCDIDGDIYKAYLSDYDGWRRSDDFEKIKSVVAWMPLPEPYKGGKS